MSSVDRLVRMLVFGVCGLAGFQTVSAQLPSLDQQPWAGYFGVFETRRFQFGVSSNGKARLIPTNEKGDPVGDDRTIRIDFGIEEVLPDGKTRMKEIKVDSLESADAATESLVKTIIRGKVTGDAAFELFVEQERGIISMGGRVTDVGTLTKDPIRFTIHATIPNIYPYVKKESKSELKAFEKMVKNDRIELKWTDGKRLKQTFEEPVDVSSKEINGPGIADVEIDLDAYKGSKLYFSASETSAITLVGPEKPAPMHEGFELRWLPDAAKDPEGKARFRFLVK